MKTMLSIPTIRLPLAAAALLIMGHAAISLPVIAAENTSKVSFSKDLTATQKEMTEAPARSPGSQGFQVVSILDRKNATYRVGEKVSLTVGTTEDAYLWVVNTGTSGKTHQVFPNYWQKDNFVKAGKNISIPSRNAMWELKVSDPPGLDLLTVIATRDATPPVPVLITKENPFPAIRKDLFASLKVRSGQVRNGNPKKSWVRTQVAFKTVR